MKKFLLILLLPYWFISFSQERYFYNGKQIDLTRSYKKISILVDDNFNLGTLPDDIVQETKQIRIDSFYSPPLRFIELKLDTIQNQVEYTQKVNALKNIDGIKYLGFYYKSNNPDVDLDVGTSNSILVRLNENETTQNLNTFANNNGLAVNNSILLPNWYELKILPENTHSNIELCQIAKDSQLFDKIDPNFMLIPIPDEQSDDNSDTNQNRGVGPDPIPIAPIHCSTDDPLFDCQWPLYNGTGVFNGINCNPTGYDFHGDFDINACEAWQYADGENTNVCIIGKDLEINPNRDYYPNIARDNTNSPISYNAATNTVPNGYHFIGDQTNYIALGIAALKDNNTGIAGLSPNTKIINVGIYDGTNIPTAATYANGIAWAVNYGYSLSNTGNQIPTQIIVSSLQLYNTNLPSSVISSTIEDAITNGRNGLGTLLVFPYSRNGYPVNNTMQFPASMSDYFPLMTILNGSRRDGISYLNYGNNLDICAPMEGANYHYTNSDKETHWGSSGVDHDTYAASYVAGTFSLMLSVNPCLTIQEANDILEQTAQKVLPQTYTYANHPGRPNGTWNEQRGYGLIDAGRAVAKARDLHKNHLDFYIKDSPQDLGAEPNYDSDILWESEDIWIRYQDDNGLEHQDPLYAPGNSVYVYVRVHNKSCYPSILTDDNSIDVYWEKSETAFTWPAPWDGSTSATNSPYPVLGGRIATRLIPALQPGEETIIKFPWNLPNPDDFVQAGYNYSDFSLLAKIHSHQDPTNNLSNNSLWNVQTNNNIAYKNISFITPTTNPIVSISVSNPYDNPHTFNLELVKDDKETGKPIYIESEIKTEMDEVLYNAWVRGGKIAEKMATTNDEKKKIVTDNHAFIRNINFEAQEAGMLTLDFNFLISEMTDKDIYKYRLLQRDAVTNEIVGGATFVIKKDPRPVFSALADDKEIDKNEPVTITAQQINEAATYNWYDAEGNLVYQGTDLTVSTDVAKKYKLEVIATADGFKDYKEVNVKLKPNRITNISPNPTSGNIQVDYKINDNASSYIMIIGAYGGSNSCNNYMIDTNQNSVNIDISEYQNGFYTVALISNGQIVDAQTISKN